MTVSSISEYHNEWWINGTKTILELANLEYVRETKQLTDIISPRTNQPSTHSKPQTSVSIAPEDIF